MVSAAAVARTRARHLAELSRSIQGHVPTPAAIAEQLTTYPYSTLGSLGDNARILEPSAGDGALIRAILDAAPSANVCAVEADPARAASLTSWAAELSGGSGRAAPPPVTVHATTFEDYAEAHPAEQYDAVIMNPPWSTPTTARPWIEHVLTAWRLLRPGGRLAAILPDTVAAAGYRPRDPNGAELRQLIDAHGMTASVDVAALAGADAVRAGFPTRACLMRLVKPIPTSDGRPSWLLCPAAGEPVPVASLDLGPTGVTFAPVQQYRDRWDGNTVRVLRYVGTCCICVRLLFAHDDGREDASIWAANSCLEATEYGQQGPSIGLCLECAHSGHLSTSARRIAARHWITSSRAAA